ncbi:MAG: pentapeptide repeat-containing protein [Gammaproteobacteria bacterium]
MADIREHLWYTRRAGRVRGPFPQRQITQCVLMGRIRDEDELSTDRETWLPLQQWPQLIPEVMKNVVTEEDRQRLVAARLRADERRGGDRRLDSQHLEADSGERRRASDRRDAEDSEILRHRALRRAILDQGRTPGGVSCGRQCRGVLLGLLVLLGLFTLFTPDSPLSRADCAAPPAPRVNWNNCRLPGLVAEQADLHGARARNMDLTGARLVGANLSGADLAYTLLPLADLRRADLGGALLVGASLRGADLRGARLAAADLSYADLRDSRLDGVDLSAAQLGNALWIDGQMCVPGSVGQCQVVREAE